MKALDKTCPHCGAKLTADYKHRKYICEYCGSEYAMETSNDQSSQTQNHNLNSPQTGKMPSGKTSASNHHVLWVLGWILAFPIPLTIIMLKNKNVLEKLSSRIRYGIIIAAWIIYVLIIASGGNEGTTTSTTLDSTNNTQISQNATEEISEESMSKKEELTGIKLLAPDGHPTLLGKSSEAHNVWNGLPSDKVLFPESTDYFKNGVTAVSLSGYNYREEDDPTITDIILDPPNAGINDMVLDDALQIVETYLPTEYLNKYYEFRDSFAVQPTSEENTGSKYYVVRYSLSSSGKEAYNNHEFNWGSIYIEIEERKDTTINSISIEIGDSPKWMSHLEMNEYQEIDWHYDFMEK